jgi:hypothetical protein
MMLGSLVDDMYRTLKMDGEDSTRLHGVTAVLICTSTKSSDLILVKA